MGGSHGVAVVTGDSRVDGCVVLSVSCKGESCRYMITLHVCGCGPVFVLCCVSDVGVSAVVCVCGGNR